jgi:hypothetical protein
MTIIHSLLIAVVVTAAGYASYLLLSLLFRPVFETPKKGIAEPRSHSTIAKDRVYTGSLTALPGNDRLRIFSYEEATYHY